MAEIRIERVSKTYRGGKAPAVDDVSLTIRDHEFMVLLGPSGCGKTTLLRMLAGLEYPDSGRILIDGKDVTDLPPRKRHIAMVFQGYAVFPHMTVFDNIAFGLRMQHRPAEEIKGRVEHAAELLELDQYLERYPAQLSGGQRQRVAVARAIVMNAALLLMDEPLSNLDALLRAQFRPELKKLVSDVQATTVYVTHDQVEALSLGDRIAVMRQGRILQADTPMAVYDYPSTQFVGSFIGDPPMNFLRGGVARENGHAKVKIGECEVLAPVQVAESGEEVLMGIRAENIEASPAEEASSQGLLAEVLVVEPLGSHLLITGMIGGQRVKLAARTNFPVKPGQKLLLKPEAEKIRWLKAADGTAIQI